MRRDVDPGLDGLALVLEDDIGLARDGVALLPGQYFVFVRLVQQHAGEERLVGQVAALLKNIVNSPVFVCGESIERMVRHPGLRTERSGSSEECGGKCDQAVERSLGTHLVVGYVLADWGRGATPNRSTLHNL